MAAIAGRVLILPRGIYNNSVTYTLLDIVYYENATYICKKTSLGNLPTDDEYWQVMVEVPSASNITPESLGIGYGVSTTAESNTNKLATLTDYQLKKNGIVAIRFNNAIPANSTLNINNAGTKPIYNRGSAITDGIIKGGDIVTMVYDGTNYDIISVDRAVGLIDDLENVTITSATDGQVLMYDGTNHVWKNATITLARLGDVTIDTITLEDGQVLVYDSESDKWINSTLALNKLSDVQITTPTVGQALIFDGEKWINGEGSNDAINAIVNVYGSKNLNSYPYKDTSKVLNGITFTLNSDGSVFIGDAQQSQTATANATFFMHDRTDGSYLNLKDGNYKISGCPNGGSDDGYYLNIVYTKSDSTTSWVHDIGNGAQLSISDSLQGVDLTKVTFSFSVLVGTTIPAGGLIVYPMIRDARITDDTFVPYAKTNKDLTNDIIGTLKPMDGANIKTVTADGVKTYANLLVELCNLVNADIDATYYISFTAFYSSDASLTVYPMQGMVTYSTEYKIDGLNPQSTNLNYVNARIATTTQRCFLYKGTVIPASSSITNIVSNKPTNGTTFGVSYFLYKKV